MKQKGSILDLLPGGNTTLGFYSFFDQILKQDEAKHIISIKGGPGVGKSSLMKKIGFHFVEQGYDVEFHHCSSDPDSLDGVVIPAFKVALLDGTAPHVVDPKNPGAVDEILNLGEYWDEEALKANQKQIVQTNRENGRLFNKAYGHLKAAGHIYENYEKTALIAFDYTQLNTIMNQMVNKLFKEIPVVNAHGFERDLFGFAITPKGVLDYREGIVSSVKNRIVIKESVFSSAEMIMNHIKYEALRRGLHITCLHSPIKINKIEDILIEELDLLIAVENKYHPYDYEYNEKLDLSTFVINSIKDRIEEEVMDDLDTFDRLLNQAINYIKKAKANHDVLETFYIPNMDFSKHEQLLNKLVDKIKKY